MTSNKAWIVVAVDGPAASGKGTISRQIATELNLAYMDTGKLYRTLTYYLMLKGRRRLYDRDRDAFEQFLRVRRPTDEELQSEFLSRHTPDVAKQKWARDLLLTAQRRFAYERVEGLCGTILDGRDIGTVVCPNADVKLFVVADVDTRARRRFDQIVLSGMPGDLKKIRDDLAFRDQKDMQRKVSPLTAAAEAKLIDTTELSIEQAVTRAISTIRSNAAWKSKR